MNISWFGVSKKMRQTGYVSEPWAGTSLWRWRWREGWRQLLQSITDNPLQVREHIYCFFVPIKEQVELLIKIHNYSMDSGNEFGRETSSVFGLTIPVPDTHLNYGNSFHSKTKSSSRRYWGRFILKLFRY